MQVAIIKLVHAIKAKVVLLVIHCTQTQLLSAQNTMTNENMGILFRFCFRNGEVESKSISPDFLSRSLS